MKIYYFNPDKGRTIEAYGSHFTLNAIGQLEEASHIILMTFTKDDNVGRHEAPISQLFYIMEGEGWVSGDDGHEHQIKAGEAAFWESGEIHGAGTKTSMKALVIESESLDPKKFMAEVKGI